MATESTVNKLLLMAVSGLFGVVLTGGGMVIRGDFLGREAAQEAKADLKEELETQLKNQNWINQLILQDLREVKQMLREDRTTASER